MRLKISRKYTLIFALTLLAVSGTAQAQMAPVQPDAETGLKLARVMCANCHMVEHGAATALADVPPFMEIARRPGRTPDYIQTYVMSPHPPMPTLQLTRWDLENLAAYIVSLAPRK